MKKGNAKNIFQNHEFFYSYYHPESVPKKHKLTRHMIHARVFKIHIEKTGGRICQRSVQKSASAFAIFE